MNNFKAISENIWPDGVGLLPGFPDSQDFQAGRRYGCIMHGSGSDFSFEQLLDKLKGCGFLSDFHLTVYCRSNSAESPAIGAPPCGSSSDSPVCAKLCLSQVSRVFEEVSERRRPTVFRCPVGVLGFAIELQGAKKDRCYLVGGGVRDNSLDLFRIEAVAKAKGINPFVLLEHVQDLPIVPEHKVNELAKRAAALIATMPGTLPATISGSASAAASEPATAERLKIIATISSTIDVAESEDQVIALVAETAGMIFDVPAIAVITPGVGDKELCARPIWGHGIKFGPVNSEKVRKKFFNAAATATTLRDDSLKELFPRVPGESATCHPLVADGEVLSVLVFLNAGLTADEYLLIELLCARAALRLARLRQEKESSRKAALSGRLLSMISTLAQVEGQELNDLILQMAAELVDATTGSLMILNDGEENLHICSAIGMSTALLKVLNIKLGSGIAGKVAASGHPLLVNDIEKDERVATANRPRFKTKSFISLPLVSHGCTTGVLNLSDKRDNGIFTENDLETLSPFVAHISSILQRTSNLEKVEALERLSITDPLTELYNRRYLERRMEEEINRSKRNHQNLTFMLIDLDYFKTYNDVCGHVAGDKALKKAAKVLRASVRDVDVVTRYGGEEFCVLLPGTSKRESIFVGERIRRDIENELFHGEEHLPFGRLTTSIGISSFPEDGATSIAVINSADIALYEAKSEGRNRIVIFNGSSHQEDGKNNKITLLKK